jgi:Thiol:disulfide interchange protein
MLVAGIFLLSAEIVGCTESIPARARDSYSQRKKTLPSIAPILTDAQLAEQFVLPEPSPSNPVVVAMKVYPATVAPGGNVELLVYLRIARAHYMHCSSGRNSNYSPVEVNVELPKDLKAQGNWRYPQPESTVGDEPVYRNALLLRLPVAVASKTPESKLNVSGKLSFQVCTDELCWPSQSVEISAPIIIQLAGGSP